MPTLAPATLLDPVVAYFYPLRVIVFGSAARGEMTPDSDIDLLAILDDDAPPAMLTYRAGIESRMSYPHPADVIPCREATFRRKAGIAGTLVYEAATAGRSCMSDLGATPRNNRFGWGAVTQYRHADLRRHDVESECRTTNWLGYSAALPDRAREASKARRKVADSSLSPPDGID